MDDFFDDLEYWEKVTLLGSLAEEMAEEERESRRLEREIGILDDENEEDEDI